MRRGSIPEMAVRFRSSRPTYLSVLDDNAISHLQILIVVAF